MNKFLTILSVFLSITFYSQTNRFVYEMKYRENASEDFRVDLMALDVDRNFVKFYDYEFVKIDSLNNRGSEFTSRYSTKSDQLIIRKLNTNKNFWYRDFFEYFVITTNDELIWKLSKETKNYEGYKLQKATTEFGGRTWTAWFSNEINLSEGPYKFRGLPGLIFLLEDDQNNFQYKLINNIKLPVTYDTSQFLETHYGKAAISTTTKDFNKFLIDMYEDPTREVRNKINNGQSISFKNEIVTNNAELNAKKDVMKKMIKARFIYIEKDKQPNFK